MNRGQSERSFPPIGTFHDGLAKTAGANLEAHKKYERVFSDYVRMLADNAKRGYWYDVGFFRTNFLQMLEHCLGFSKWARTKRGYDANIILTDPLSNLFPRTV
jgi:hypothetical protein